MLVQLFLDLEVSHLWEMAFHITAQKGWVLETVKYFLLQLKGAVKYMEGEFLVIVSINVCWLYRGLFLPCQSSPGCFPVCYKPGWADWLSWGLFFWYILQFSSVQLLSRVWLFVTPWTAARQASLSITNSNSFHWVGDAIQPSHPLFSPSPALNLSQHQFFSNESALCIRWPKDWSFSFSISPSNEHPGLISFRMDWLDLLAVQGTLNSLLQHHSSKASILQCSALFIVQLSHPYMTTGKNHTLD